MKQYLIQFIMFISLAYLCSCNKEADNLMEYLPYTNKYTLVDSVILVNNTMIDSTTIYHYPISRPIDILFSYSRDFIVYNTDTFLFDATYGYMFKGSLPFINFKNDSVIIHKKLGGVGIQTWEYKYGIKN